jgi:hypothetical protein
MKTSKAVIGKFLAAAAGIVLLAGTSAFAQSRQNPERYTATALVEGTAGPATFVDIDITIFQYSTAQDQQTLIQAFEQGKEQGLVNALSRMSAKGHVSIPGTLGYDLAYIMKFPTPDGMKIRMVSNRPIRFGEAWADGRSMDYDLGLFELDLNNADPKKSGGIVIYAGQLQIKDGHLNVESYGSGPFKFVRVKTWQ